MNDVDTAWTARAEAAKALLSLILAVSVGFWAQTALRHLANAESNWNSEVDSMQTALLLTGFAGVIFLIDILCIAWWYANYIYRIEPTATFGQYFADFVICSMFVLAAYSWDKLGPFLISVGAGSILLVGRFYVLYRSPSASQKDRSILKSALVMLVGALLLAITGLAIIGAVADGPSSSDDEKISLFTSAPYDYKDHLFFALSLTIIPPLIGVGLTVALKQRIEVASDVAAPAPHRFRPLPLVWSPELKSDPNAKPRIRSNVREGLKSFSDLFIGPGVHVRLASRVHPDSDLLIQSCILAVPSATDQRHAAEIRHKAFVTAASHWLDDLVDGRDEIRVCRKIAANPLSTDLRESESLFDQIYRPLVVKHTERSFWNLLKHKLAHECCPGPINTKYLYLGMIRVAYGAVMFSPKIDPEKRSAARRAHNEFLQEWNVEGDEFTNRVEHLIETMACNDVGEMLLGLTTKTVQELAMSSENQTLNPSVSILMSILFAPLLYYHDIENELMAQEMIPMGAYDSDFEMWLEWLLEARAALDMVHPPANSNHGQDPEFSYAPDVDERIESRRTQLDMAFRCFQKKLPKIVREALRPVYSP